MFARSLVRLASILPSSIKHPLSGLRPLYTFVMGMGEPVIMARTAAGNVRWQVDGLTSQTFVLGTYEPYMQEAFVRFVRPGSVVYDVGAHAGYHTVLCALLVGDSGSIISFEPNPANFHSISRQLDLNSLTQVTISPFALSDRCGSQRMDISINSRQGRLSASGDLKIETHTCDCLVETQGFKPPDLIKIDVEGHEGQALEGMQRTLERYKPVVLCDYNDSSTLDTVSGILRPLGYQTAAGPPITSVHFEEAGRSQS